MSILEARVEAERSNKTPGTLRDLMQRYQASPEARGASPSTRRQRDRAIQRALKRFGKDTLSEVEHRGFRSRLYDWRDTFADRPAEGQNNLRVVCTVLNWGVDRGWLRDNPAAGLKPLRRRVSRADSIWKRADLQALSAVSPPWLQDVITVALYTGLRESDILRITKDDCEQGWLTITPRKTRNSSGVRLELPYYMIRPLAEVFTRLLPLHWLKGEPMFRRYDGQRWAERELRRQFTAAKTAAGLGALPLRFHDIRGTLTTHLLEAGCTDAEVGAVTGGALAKGNTRAYAARTRELASNAYEKLAAKMEKS
jgi:integrase